MRCNGAFESGTLATGIDLNGDGVPDTLFHNPWKHVTVVDGATKASPGYFWSFGGDALACRPWRPKRGQPPRIFLATENGVGVYDPAARKPVWEFAGSPITGVDVGDLNGDGRDEVALAREDGFYLLLDDGGRVLQRRLLDAPIRGVAILPGRVCLATDAGLGLLDASGKLVGLSPGEWTRVLAVATPDGPRLLAAGKDGTLALFR